MVLLPPARWGSFKIAAFRGGLSILISVILLAFLISQPCLGVSATFDLMGVEDNVSPVQLLGNVLRRQENSAIRRAASDLADKTKLARSFPHGSDFSPFREDSWRNFLHFLAGGKCEKKVADSPPRPRRNLCDPDFGSRPRLWRLFPELDKISDEEHAAEVRSDLISDFSDFSPFSWQAAFARIQQERLCGSMPAHFFQYRCEGWCSGLGDRVKGFMNIFTAALLSGTGFLGFMDYPTAPEAAYVNQSLLNTFVPKHFLWNMSVLTSEDEQYVYYKRTSEDKLDTSKCDIESSLRDAAIYFQPKPEWDDLWTSPRLFTLLTDDQRYGTDTRKRNQILEGNSRATVHALQNFVKEFASTKTPMIVAGMNYRAYPVWKHIENAEVLFISRLVRWRRTPPLDESDARFRRLYLQIWEKLAILDLAFLGPVDTSLDERGLSLADRRERLRLGIQLGHQGQYEGIEDSAEDVNLVRTALETIYFNAVPIEATRFRQRRLGGKKSKKAVDSSLQGFDMLAHACILTYVWQPSPSLRMDVLNSMVKITLGAANVSDETQTFVRDKALETLTTSKESELGEIGGDFFGVNPTPRRLVQPGFVDWLSRIPEISNRSRTEKALEEALDNFWVTVHVRFGDAQQGLLATNDTVDVRMRLDSLPNIERCVEYAAKYAMRMQVSLEGDCALGDETNGGTTFGWKQKKREFMFHDGDPTDMVVESYGSWDDFERTWESQRHRVKILISTDNLRFTKRMKESWTGRFPQSVFGIGDFELDEVSPSLSPSPSSSPGKNQIDHAAWIATDVGYHKSRKIARDMLLVGLGETMIHNRSGFNYASRLFSFLHRRASAHVDAEKCVLGGDHPMQGATHLA